MLVGTHDLSISKVLVMALVAVEIRNVLVAICLSSNACIHGVYAENAWMLVCH